MEWERLESGKKSRKEGGESMAEEGRKRGRVAGFEEMEWAEEETGGKKGTSFKRGAGLFKRRWNPYQKIGIKKMDEVKRGKEGKGNEDTKDEIGKMLEEIVKNRMDADEPVNRPMKMIDKDLGLKQGEEAKEVNGDADEENGDQDREAENETMTTKSTGKRKRGRAKAKQKEDSKAPEPILYDGMDINVMTHQELKKICEELDVSNRGNRFILRKRIREKIGGTDPLRPFSAYSVSVDEDKKRSTRERKRKLDDSFEFQVGLLMWTRMLSLIPSA